MNAAVASSVEERTSIVLPSVGPDHVPKRVQERKEELLTQYEERDATSGDADTE